jgi:hypothetical protein
MNPTFEEIRLMTQYPTSFNDPYANPMGEPAKTSGLAITALVMSLIICCPLTTVLGVVLGGIAFVTIGSNPMRKGKGLAVAAILIGLVATVLWVIGGLWFKNTMEKFFQTLTEGPTTAMKAGFASDEAGFKAQFYGVGASATDAEVSAFIEDLRSRYGEFVAADMDQNAKPSQPPFGKTTIPFPYQLTFDKATVSAEVSIVIADEKTGQWVWKLGSITVHDPQGATIAFPPGPSTTGGARTGRPSSTSSAPVDGEAKDAGDADEAPPDTPNDGG